MAKPSQHVLNLKQKELADLYFDSDTVKFGAFKLAAHEANPDLELSPIYLHYPKPGEAGTELLPRIYVLAAGLFSDLISEKGLEYDRMAAVPKGAQPVAEELAKLEPDGENKLLEFGKEEADGRRVFVGPIKGDYQKGHVLMVVEDHTSGGYNKSLFKNAAEKAGLVVNDILTVVDRQQGAMEYLTSQGVGFHSIFTLDELLDHYVETKRIELEKAKMVRDYIKRNQIQVA
ncbi:MAG TPA: hypothetical protein VLE72_02425 [Candidatus Saccharimonadales bacterium]|nr:hypothetical protein [Candidatus Saccharimonadales bacterium]